MGFSRHEIINTFPNFKFDDAWLWVAGCLPAIQTQPKGFHVSAWVVSGSRWTLTWELCVHCLAESSWSRPAWVWPVVSPNPSRNLRRPLIRIASACSAALAEGWNLSPRLGMVMAPGRPVLLDYTSSSSASRFVRCWFYGSDFCWAAPQCTPWRSAEKTKL